ncbi:type I-G CRISPR-associated protein Cas8g1/Csx17 [Actinomadura macrotermitis]|uniref:Type I-U CRISPR-associated protein Csx17 n=1 Tax=Actinomadura macrotermitis TaxID=2585200 RepID=A0A7K0BT48_9ACTN|nr:type I-U CRISPR-associated protein Csx17 [Actinomadura macrotermitis]MQY04331.1 hypothetical protein [Actinomadura macrotermitis]
MTSATAPAIRTHKLAGLRADTLAGYLGALGLLRTITAQKDPAARLAWSGDVAVLSTSLSADELTGWLVDEYAPSPIVSPWNAGSGFAGNGKSVTAEKALDAFRRSEQPRFAGLRAVIEQADQVVAIARERGWEGGPLWAADRKADVVRLCRARLSDEALPWLDVAVTLTTDDVRFSPLTGTGGNFGRQELSATFLQRLLLVAGPDARRAKAWAWAQAALFGREDVPYLRDTVGQYDPGRAGGILSSPHEKADDAGFANPWSLILSLEGTLLFASAVTRRNHTALGESALPFLTRASAVGYDTAATGEEVKGEQWIPLWPQPAGLAEVEHLLGEGRAQWNGRQARTGLEFTLAVASLGVDRGLSAFRRFVIASRLGQNPLAVPVGRLPVQAHSEVEVLRAPYEWLQRLKRIALPAGVATALRRTEQSVYDAAAGGGGAALARFVIEFGRLHQTVGKSGAVRGQLGPFYTTKPGDWLALLPDSDELWIAAGFASLQDPQPDRSLCGLVSRVQAQPGKYGRRELTWSDRTATRLDLNGATLATVLAQAHRLCTFPAGSPSPNAVGEDDGGRVVSSSFQQGQVLPVGLVQDYALGKLDDQLTADYLNGLLALGCRYTTAAAWPRTPKPLLHPMLAALLPFYGTTPLPLRPVGLPKDDHSADFSTRPVARPEWITRLLAAGPSSISADVLRWLSINGCPPVLEAADLTRMPIDGARLAGALLLRVPSSHRTRAVIHVAAVAAQPTSQPSEGARS